MELNGAIIFMGLCLFSPMLFSVALSAIEKLERPKVIIKEVIKTEYIEVERIKEVQVEKIKPADLPEPTKPQPQQNPIKDECLQCLVSLGMKKSVAKDKVNKMWANKNYTSIEGFLMDAYRV